MCLFLYLRKRSSTVNSAWMEKYVMSAPYVLNRVRQIKTTSLKPPETKKEPTTTPFSPPAFPEQILFLPCLLKMRTCALDSWTSKNVPTLLFWWDLRQSTPANLFFFCVQFLARFWFEILHTPTLKLNLQQTKCIDLLIRSALMSFRSKGWNF